MEKSASVEPDMNVTPLVDVVLVLLIIFMVVAPRMDEDVPVELPAVLNPDPRVEEGAEPLEISLASDGGVYLERQRLELDAAVEALASKHAENPHRRLVIRADRRLTYGQVRDVLDRTRRAGFPGTSLVVGEKPDPEGDRERESEG